MRTRDIIIGLCASTTPLGCSSIKPDELKTHSSAVASAPDYCSLENLIRNTTVSPHDVLWTPSEDTTNASNPLGPRKILPVEEFSLDFSTDGSCLTDVPKYLKACPMSNILRASDVVLEIKRSNQNHPFDLDCARDIALDRPQKAIVSNDYFESYYKVSSAILSNPNPCSSYNDQSYENLKKFAQEGSELEAPLANLFLGESFYILYNVDKACDREGDAKRNLRKAYDNRYPKALETILRSIGGRP